MIKSKDIFMPCLKAKNKVIVQATESAADLIASNSNGQPLNETLHDIIVGSPESQMLLQNFTAEADFAANPLA